MLRTPVIALLTLTMIASPSSAQLPKPSMKLDPALAKSAAESIDKAIGFFRTQQGDDGGLAPKSPFEMGVTAIAVAGMIGTQRIKPDDPMIAKAMAFMEKHVQPDPASTPKDSLGNRTILPPSRSFRSSRRTKTASTRRSATTPSVF